MRHATFTTLPMESTRPSVDELAIAGHLARYSGPTLDSYRQHARTFLGWCESLGVRPLELNRAQIELHLRYCENARGNLPQTVETRLVYLRSMYRSAVIDGYIEASPAAYVDPPRWYRDETRLVQFGRREVYKMAEAAKHSTPCEEALILLGMFMGLRNSEIRGVRIEHCTSIERGHHVLHLVGKGNKAATMPIPAPVWRAVERARGDRTRGHLIVKDWADGTPMSSHSVNATAKRVARRAGLGSLGITAHSLRHIFVTIGFELGEDVQSMQVSARHGDPKTTLLYRRNLNVLDRHAAHTIAAHFAV